MVTLLWLLVAGYNPGYVLYITRIIIPLRHAVNTDTEAGYDDNSISEPPDRGGFPTSKPPSSQTQPAKPDLERLMDLECKDISCQRRGCLG
ncbi:hypothetical protein V8F06_000096 [Rhypophila decipiens]